MILKSVNNNVKSYGFPEVLEYDDKTFHGTQKGVCICIKDNESGDIVTNNMPIPYIKDELGYDKEAVRLRLLNQLLEDRNVLLIEEGIVQTVDGELKPRTIYYIPYYVADHSILKPTVLYENISGACNVSYNISIEVLFVEDDLNRYATLNFQTRNVSIMDLVYNLFDQDEPEELMSIGLCFKKETEDNEEGYYLDFYDEAGNRYELCFSILDRLRDSIVSMRLIDIKCKVDGVDEIGDES